VNLAKASLTQSQSQAFRTSESVFVPSALIHVRVRKALWSLPNIDLRTYKDPEHFVVQCQWSLYRWASYPCQLCTNTDGTVSYLAWSAWTQTQTLPKVHLKWVHSQRRHLCFCMLLMCFIFVFALQSYWTRYHKTVIICQRKEGSLVAWTQIFLWILCYHDIMYCRWWNPPVIWNIMLRNITHS